MNILKNVGNFLLTMVFITISCFVAAVILRGTVWLAHKLYPFAVFITVFGAYLLPVFLLLALFRKTRGFAAGGIIVVSYGWGFALWIVSVLVLYSVWGGFGLFLGLILTPFGAVPTAAVASLFHGDFKGLGFLVGCVVAVILLRVFGVWLSSKTDHPQTEYLVTQ